MTYTNEEMRRLGMRELFRFPEGEVLLRILELFDYQEDNYSACFDASRQGFRLVYERSNGLNYVHLTNGKRSLTFYRPPLSTAASDLRLASTATTRVYTGEAAGMFNAELVHPMQLIGSESELRLGVGTESNRNAEFRFTGNSDYIRYECQNRFPFEIAAEINIDDSGASLRRFLGRLKYDAPFIISKVGDSLVVASVDYDNENDNYAITALTEPTAAFTQGCTLVGDVSDDVLAAMPASELANSLFRRKRTQMGILNYLSHVNSSFDLVSIGATTGGQVFCKFESADIGTGRGFFYIVDDSVARREASNLLEAARESEISVTKRQRRRRRTAPSEPVAPTPVLEEVVEAVEQVLTQALDEGDREVLDRWLQAHIRFCEARGVSQSTNRSVWFSHYTMELIRNGESPNEADISLAGRI